MLQLQPVSVRTPSGTETNGSILSPSSMDGLVGFKPTVGLVSGKGVVPISPRQDAAGPMCRTVADAAILATTGPRAAAVSTSRRAPARPPPLRRCAGPKAEP